MPTPDTLTELANLGVQYTIIGDAKGNARVNIANDGPTFGPLADAIRAAIEQYQRRAGS